MVTARKGGMGVGGEQGRGAGEVMHNGRDSVSHDNIQRPLLTYPCDLHFLF